MIALLPSLIAAAAALALVQTILMWTRCLINDAQAASEMLDDNYRAANALIQNAETPDSVVRFVGFAIQHAGHPALARQFARHILFGRLRKPRVLGTHAAQLKADLTRLTPVAQEHFATFVGTTMASSAASDPLFSRVYLFVVGLFLSASGQPSDRKVSVDRAETAAIDLSDSAGCAYA